MPEKTRTELVRMTVHSRAVHSLVVALFNLLHACVDLPLNVKFSAQVRSFGFETLQAMFEP